MRTEEAVSPAMRERVLAALNAIEARHNVRVLYACESGSRGWGFASPTVTTMCALSMCINPSGICASSHRAM